MKAATLADHFSTNSKPVGAKVDGYFEPAGKNLLAGLLLAAAQDRRPITDVYRWLTRPDDKTPADLLEKYDIPLTADNVAGVIARTEKQRDGIYCTAEQMASCLTTRSLLRWVTDDGSRRRRHFDPAAFVREDGTLYSLSRAGAGATLARW